MSVENRPVSQNPKRGSHPDGEIQVAYAELSGSFPRTVAYLESWPPNKRQLLFKLMQSADFQYALGWLENCREEDQLRFQERKASLTGYLFETAAYLQLKDGWHRSGVILLSPQETFEVYRLLHPDKPVVETGNSLQRGLEGITVPNGLIVTKSLKGTSTRIDGLYEYQSRWVNKVKYLRKPFWYKVWLADDIKPLIDTSNASAISVGEYIHSRYPQLPRRVSVNQGNLRVFYAVPYDQVSRLDKYDVQTSKIPISTGEFDRFLETLMADVRPKPSP